MGAEECSTIVTICKDSLRNRLHRVLYEPVKSMKHSSDVSRCIAGRLLRFCICSCILDDVHEEMHISADR